LFVPYLSFAEDGAFIAGANFSTSVSGEAEVELDTYYGDLDISEDIDSNSFSVFAGYQTARNNRFKLSYESRSFDFDKSNETEDTTAFRFDWDFVYGEHQVHPFWSIGVGFYNLQDPIILDGSSLEGDDMDGVSFQMGAGAKVDLTEQLELSIAFERQAIGWQEIKESSSGLTANMTYVHNSLAAGLLYRF